MLMTAEQAQNTGCPIYAMVGAFAISPGIRIGSGDPHVNDPKKGKCIAEGCMMWREGEPEAEWRELVSFLDQKPEKWTIPLLERATKKAKEEGFTLGRGAAMNGHFVIVGKFIAKRGYCGLAGAVKP